jgi:hypothetical protein
MFGFRKKPQDNSNSFIAFDLRPLFNSLTASQKIQFEPLANSFHFEVHHQACVMGYRSLLRCWVAIKKELAPAPALLEPSAMAILERHYLSTKSNYEVLFPVSELESVKALSRFVTVDIDPSNHILSQISGECAVNILKKKFVQPQSIRE